MSQLSSSPFQVLTYAHLDAATKKRKGTPIMMEFPVNPHLAPFLVSSSASTLWVRRARTGVVRAATREIGELNEFFVEVLDAVIVEGRASDWGNIQPLSREGILAAIGHVESYGLENLELLANPKIDWNGINSEWDVPEDEIVMSLLDLPVQSAPWLPLDTVVIVPKERDLVGFVLLFEQRIASVIQNASRGMGVATSRVPVTEEPVTEEPVPTTPTPDVPPVPA